MRYGRVRRRTPQRGDERPDVAAYSEPVDGVEQQAGPMPLVDWAQQALSIDGWRVEETPAGILARRDEVALEIEQAAIEEFAGVRDPLGFLFLVRVRFREAAGAPT